MATRSGVHCLSLGELVVDIGTMMSLHDAILVGMELCSGERSAFVVEASGKSCVVTQRQRFNVGPSGRTQFCYG